MKIYSDKNRNKELDKIKYTKNGSKITNKG